MLVFSENNLFFLEKDDNGDAFEFYVKKDISPYISQKYGKWLLNIDDNITVENITYVKFKPSFRIKDPQCLQLAEGISIKEPNYQDNVSLLKVKYLDELFGIGDDANIALSQGFKRLCGSEYSNRNADPKEGEAYAIVRQKIQNKKTPFHIAYVILKDGNTTLTIETDASNEQEHRPVFDIYTIGNKYSFHDIYKDIYSIKSKKKSIYPITIILYRDGKRYENIESFRQNTPTKKQQDRESILKEHDIIEFVESLKEIKKKRKII
jgi:hypothetical protein